MRILVTGGAGFIGSHIVDALLQRGDDVCVLDDLSSGRRENLSPNAELIVGDVCDARLVSDIFARVAPEIVCHQAAQVSVPRSFENPALDLEVNALGSLILLIEAAKHNARFVFGSSGGAIYGEVAEGQSATLDTPALPRTPYGCSKLAAETYLQIYSHCAALRVAILRYSNVYGPRQDSRGEGGVIAVFAAALARGEELRVYGRRSSGDEGCVRDYVFVDDVVQANLAAIEGELDGRIVNVSTGIGTSTRQLAHALAELEGRPAKIVHAPPRAGDVARSVLAPTLRSAHATSLRTGLAVTLSWAKQNLSV